jgi:glycosyltransferase involved in cell wall biosynthesis
MVISLGLILIEKIFSFKVASRRRLGVIILLTRVLIAKVALKNATENEYINDEDQDYFRFRGVYLLSDSSKMGGIFKNSSFIADDSRFKLISLQKLLSYRHSFECKKILIPLGDSRDFDLYREATVLLNDWDVTILLHDVTAFLNWVKVVRLLTIYQSARISLTTLERIRKTKILVHSEFAYNQVTRNSFFENVQIIETGVPFFYPRKTNTNSPLDKIVIGTAGYWNSARNPYRTMRVFIKLATENADWKFSWGGELPEFLKTRLERIWIHKFENLERLDFLGFIPENEFAKYLSDLSALVYLRTTTSGESSGLVIESARQGTPIVFNTIGALSELKYPPFKKLSENPKVAVLAEAVEEVVKDHTQRLVIVAGLLDHSVGKDIFSYREAILAKIFEV